MTSDRTRDQRIRFPFRWRPAALVVLGALIALFLPDGPWHWLFGIGFGAICFVFLLQDPEKPGVGAAIGLVTGGAIVLAFAASRFPDEVLHSWQQLLKADWVMFNWLWAGTGLIVGGLLWALWLGVVGLVRHFLRTKPNRAFEDGRAEKLRAAQRER